MEGERRRCGIRLRQRRRMIVLLVGVVLVFLLHPRIDLDGGVKSGRVPIGMGKTQLSIQLDVTLTLELSVSLGHHRIISRFPVSVAQIFLMG